MDAMKLHEMSEYYASLAEISRNSDDYAIAARLEKDAVEALKEYRINDTIPTRTLGIFAVSAASLYWKAGEFGESIGLAQKYLEMPDIQEFAKVQLRELVN
jgi:hypothetical protein